MKTNYNRRRYLIFRAEANRILSFSDLGRIQITGDSGQLERVFGISEFHPMSGMVLVATTIVTGHRRLGAAGSLYHDGIDTWSGRS